MSGAPRAVVLATITATLGVTGGIAYAALPHSNSKDTSATVSVASASREVLGPQIVGKSVRKFSLAKCRRGESVSGGGYDLQGAGDGFSTQGAPAPRAIPVVIGSKAYFQSRSPGAVPDAWGVTAVAPRNFSGTWALLATAMCG